MNKLIKNGIVFTLCSAGIYLFAFSCLFFIKVDGIPLYYRCSKGNVTKGGGTYIKFRNFNINEKWDVVILGSSHAYRGYDPQIFETKGFKTYNLGSSAQSIMCSYQVARTYLDSTNCKSIILDVYDRIFGNNSIESISDLLSNSQSDVLAFRIALASKDPRALNMFTLHCLNKNGAILDTDTLEYVRGYVPSYSAFATTKTFKPINYSQGSEQLKYLNDLLNYCKSQNIKVVIVEHPLPKVFMPGNHDNFVKDIKSVADKYAVPFLDYSISEGMTGLQFYKDENHLNANGVQRFNENLIKDLLKDRLLPEASNTNTLSYLK